MAMEPNSGIFSNLYSYFEKFVLAPLFGTISAVKLSSGKEYTVTADISSLCFANKHISIQLIGTDDESSLQPLSTSPIKITCPTLGKFLLVKLVFNVPFWGQKAEFYCNNVTVITPEGEIRNFPCYRYLDGKNPEMTLTDNNAFIDVPRTHQEIPTPLIKQRAEELKKRQRVFEWKDYAEGLPKIIGANSVSDLPREIWFSFKKQTDLISTVFLTLTELQIETLFHWKKEWNNLDELKKLLPMDRTTVTEYVIEHWREDEFFGFQLLNGLNPMMIRRCTKLPEGSSFTDKMMKNIFEGTTLSREMKNGNIFICDYKRQRDLTANTIKGVQQYLNSPIVLLRLEDDKLIPFAIQITQDKDKKHTVVLRNAENEWNWTLAKTIVRAAEFAEHELNFHLLRTHLLGEVFTIATYRTLPSSHPLFKLLLPHTRYNLVINFSAREKLISDTGVFASYTAVGKKSSMIKFLQEAMSAITYRSLCLPDDIKDRGLGNIPHFYYREDGKCLWDITLTFVTDVLQDFYNSDDDVKGDKDLQNWTSEIFVNGFNSRQESGIPSSLSSLDELYKFVTMIIFTVTSQHAAVNHSQFDYGFWLPNFPSTLRAHPSCEGAETSEQTLRDTLPDVGITLHGLTVLKTLSTKSTDNRTLGDYREELFGTKEIKKKILEFQGKLKVLGHQIHSRNELTDELCYTYLNPANVPNSVNL